MEKILSEVSFLVKTEAEPYRRRMNDFQKSSKKVIQIAFEVASSSPHEKYAKVFMEKNQAFEANRNAVWQKNTSHFDITKVLDGLTGSNLSGHEKQKIYECFVNYTSAFEDSINRYTSNPTKKEMGNLVNEIRYTG